MIVDCHTHIRSPEDETEASEHWGAAQTVDACIVLAGLDGTREETNKNLAAYVKKHKEKMVGFAVVDPAQETIEKRELNYLTDKLGFKGLVVYCSASGFHPAHSQAMIMYESAQKMRLPIFFHNGGLSQPNAVLDYAQPYLLDEIARTFRDLKIIVGSMGVPFVEQTISLVAKNDNVFGDLTINPGNVWQTYNMVMAANERGVMNKLVFGSGFPSGRASKCIESLLGFNMLMADTHLPTVPRSNIRNIIERDSLALLGITDWAGRAKSLSKEENGARTMGQ